MAGLISLRKLWCGICCSGLVGSGDHSVLGINLFSFVM